MSAAKVTIISDSAKEKRWFSLASNKKRPIVLAVSKKRVNFAAKNKKNHVMNAIAMNNLWSYLQGLSLTASNRKWLAERLVEPTKGTVMSDEEIREGLIEAFQQLEEVKAGKRKTRKAEVLLYEL